MSGRPAKVTVAVPATTANLGPGFDCLGLALKLHNEFAFTASEWVDSSAAVQLTVRTSGEGERQLPRDHDNLVWRAARTVFEAAGRYPARLSLEINCDIPLGKGLGSSASAIVGGVWGAAALLGEHLAADRLLSLAVELEGHPDNVVPAALGGLTVCAGGGGAALPLYQRLDMPPGLRAVVAVPSFSLRTSESRRRLPRQVPLSDAVYNLSHAAALVVALWRGDWEAAGSAMDDRLHQPYRAPLVPGFADVCRAARGAGAFGAALSGAGPSVLALVAPGVGGEGAAPEARLAAVSEGMERAFLAAGVSARMLVLQPASGGVRITGA